ncbi:MAG: hypothetical protein V4479_04140 [Actinomycetota bacterium]
MIPYETAAWHDLFVAAGGAAAALDGLLVVAASINVKEILASPGLPRLAARALGLLLSLLLMSLFVLTPGQSSTVLGIEIGALGLVLAAAMTYSVIRSHFPVERWSWTAPTLGARIVDGVLVREPHPLENPDIPFSELEDLFRSMPLLTWTAPTLGLALAASIPMIVCGVSLVVGAGGGLYWALGELVVGFSCAIYYAWILLIEILR